MTPENNSQFHFERPLDRSSKIYHLFQSEGMNFTAFSRSFPYRRENTELILETMFYLPDRFTCVDIGSGNGLAAQLVKGMTEIFLREATMWAIDPDPFALGQAEQDTPSSDRFKVFWVKGFGQDVEALLKGQIPEQGVDLVSYLGCIHEFPPDDQAPILAAGTRILRPGGIMVMNSQFTDIATEGYETLWAMPVTKAAMKFGKVTKAGKPGLLQRPIAEYTQMGTNTGLKLVYHQVIPVIYSTQEAVDISRYPGYAEGARKSFVFAEGEPSLEDFSRELQLSYGRSKSLTRQSVRWIFQKPN